MIRRFAIAVPLAVALLGALGLVAGDGPTAKSSDSSRHGESWTGGRVWQNEPIDTDLPNAQQIENIPSRVDDNGRPTKNGDGMCVTSAVEAAARWQGIESMRGFRDWAANFPGGCHRTKLDKQIQEFCAMRGQPIPPYLQYEGPDYWPIVEAALRSGRMVAGTYGWSPRYKDRSGSIPSYIAHMVNYVKATGNFACVLDNNFIGSDRNLEWMAIPTAIHRCKWPMRTGWVFVWLAPPPPPSPHN